MGEEDVLGACTAIFFWMSTWEWIVGYREDN